MRGKQTRIIIKEGRNTPIPHKRKRSMLWDKDLHKWKLMRIFRHKDPEYFIGYSDTWIYQCKECGQGLSLHIADWEDYKTNKPEHITGEIVKEWISRQEAF